MNEETTKRYRLLNVGETIQEGDEYEDRGNWYAVIETIGERLEHNAYAFRRPLNPQERTNTSMGPNVSIFQLAWNETPDTPMEGGDDLCAAPVEPPPGLVNSTTPSAASSGAPESHPLATPTLEEVARETASQLGAKFALSRDSQSTAATHILAALQSVAATLREENENELRRWQDAIRDKLMAVTGINIDGSGCDSGDPLDLTLAEVSQAINHLSDELAQVKAERDDLAGQDKVQCDMIKTIEDENSELRSQVETLTRERDKLAEGHAYLADMRDQHITERDLARTELAQVKIERNGIKVGNMLLIGESKDLRSELATLTREKEELSDYFNTHYAAWLRERKDLREQLTLARTQASEAMAQVVAITKVATQLITQIEAEGGHGYRVHEFAQGLATALAIALRAALPDSETKGAL